MNQDFEQIMQDNAGILHKLCQVYTCNAALSDYSVFYSDRNLCVRKFKRACKLFVIVLVEIYIKITYSTPLIKLKDLLKELEVE